MPSLLIDIAANVARLQQDMNKAQRSVKGFADAAKTALGGLGLYFGTREIVRWASETLAAADKMAKLSQTTGVAVETLSSYSHAANLAGVNLDAVGKGLTDLSRRMVDMDAGGGRGKIAFETLGISVKDAQGRLRDANEVMLDVADKFAGMEDGAAKAAIAQKMFGESGAQLIPMLNNGREGLQAMRDEAEKLGLVMSKETAQAAERVNDNVTRLKASFQGASIQIMDATLPALTELTEYLVKAAEGFALLINQSESMKMQRQRMAILDQIEELEGYLSKGQTWWDRMKEYMGAGMAVEGGVPGKVLGTREEWEAKKSELEQQLMEISRRMADIRNQPFQTTSDKKIAPVFADAEAEKAREKWLKEYLAGVDRAMEAERKRSELIGELYMLDVEWERKKQDEIDKLRKAALDEQASWAYEVGPYHADALDTMVKQAEVANDDIKNAITGWASGFSKTLSDMVWDADFSFKKIAESFGRMMTEMLMQKFIVGKMLGFAFGSFHGGGIVGKEGRTTMIAPTAFDTAPRFHSGLRPTEYPAILEKGEGVFTREQMKSLAPAKGGQSSSVTVENITINAVDAASFYELTRRNPNAIIGPFMEALGKGGMLRNAIREVM